jgi:hypothetical protein
MDAFVSELMRRSPLAGCALELSDFMFDDGLLKSLYDEHRGQCYEDVLTFPTFLRLIRDALIRHGGSGHKLFVELEREQREPIDESNFYRKLARTPVAVSRALLRCCTSRLVNLMPTGVGVTLPACFEGFAVVAGDGKKIKNAAKRLAPTRGFAGRLLGAKALVAMDLRSGLAIAMSDSLDGEANDVPLVPALIEQLHEVVAGPMLSIWDRQFGDVRTLMRISQREGDAFLVRLRANLKFSAVSRRESTDTQGRQIIDEQGVLGSGTNTLTLRRITLVRGGDADDIILVTNLIDADRFSAEDLLALYRHRWGIEQVFQQVTQTFSLEHLIGSAPQAALLQFAMCLLLYNLVEVIKAYVAQDGKVLAAAVSTFYLFSDLRQELGSWAYHTDGNWPRTPRDSNAMIARLRELLHDSYDPVAYKKQSDKKPRKKKPPARPIVGGHTSVYRLINAHANT